MLSFLLLCSGTPPVDLRLPFDLFLDELADVPLASCPASSEATGAESAFITASSAEVVVSLGFSSVVGGLGGLTRAPLICDSAKRRD